MARHQSTSSSIYIRTPVQQLETHYYLLHCCIVFLLGLGHVSNAARDHVNEPTLYRTYIETYWIGKHRVWGFRVLGILRTPVWHILHCCHTHSQLLPSKLRSGTLWKQGYCSWQSLSHSTTWVCLGQAKPRHLAPLPQAWLDQTPSLLLTGWSTARKWWFSPNREHLHRHRLWFHACSTRALIEYLADDDFLFCAGTALSARRPRLPCSKI